MAYSTIQLRLQPILRLAARIRTASEAGDAKAPSRVAIRHDSFNGDLGRVIRIDREEGALVAVFDGREVTYSFGELDAVVPAYATTIHKSQGSEYPAVVVTLATQHYAMRNLVYTAVTRGKRLVVIVGQKKALAIAIRNTRTNRRWTRLKEWLGRARVWK